MVKNCPATSYSYPRYGTQKALDAVNDLGGLPTRNYSSGSFEKAEKIGCEYIRETVIKRGARTTHICMPGCIVKCSNTFNDRQGNELTGGFEFECIWALGANLGIDDIDAIAYMNRACDELGVDCIETGVSIGIVMESGYIPFGDKKGAIRLINEIRKNTELGKVIASGSVVTGKVFGVKRVPQVKGQAMTAWDPRAVKGMGVTFATSPMGADHTAGFTSRYEVFETGKSIDPYINEGKIELSREFQKYNAFMDSAGLCMFIDPAIQYDEKGLTPIKDIINARFGLSIDESDIFKMGSKVLKLEREFNKKCGISKYSNDLPEFFRREKLDTNGLTFDIDRKDLISF
jgi:aldehyde:ferredoxin oxidoreductase